MRLLLDSHVLLWATSDPEQLSGKAHDLIEDTGNECVVSTATCWELLLKQQAGKIHFDEPVTAWIERYARTMMLQILPITLAHVKAMVHLPLRKNHKDPFDRLLVAQAIAEGCKLVTKDRKLEDYGVEVIW